MSDKEQAAAAVERAMKLQAGTVLAREVDRLRAELAETRAAGDALAEALNDLLVQLPGYMGPTAARPEREAAVEADNAWRSVRGDAPAPAEPPAASEPARPTFRDDPHPLYPHFPARGPGAVEAALDRLSRYGSGAEVHDLLVSARAELEHLIPAGPLLERFPAPADDTAAPDRVELLGRACEYAEGVVFGDHPEDAPGTVRDGLANGWMAGYLAAGQPVRDSQPETI